ncbi:AAA family ATPase [Thermodesulfobacterium sp. TA1]|uniref:bifunctional aminoglycoside phosphotransferase/ATP-binding protein n=1 Tax=Thermodesulfobacterium sp. TA1 TaxID=2234087 RepID=UPI0012323A0C|nr:AAA family ATPase [Thermodesulfobacterium sp. TA1]QER41698.1 AAA family ATPase [Thermodesulfobacterium sp. TA1]
MEITAWERLIDFNSFPFQPQILRIVQTHISYVFITDLYVYKIKKPVNFGFLDYTTLEKRKYFCEREVVLNRRLCPEIYLGVVPVVKTSEGYKFEAEGELVDYAVKMKKLPEEGMMSLLLKEKSISDAHIDLIVSVLVPFYQQAETGEKVNSYGTIEVISFNTEENFVQTKDFVGIAIANYKYDHIIRFTRGFLEQQKDLFQARIDQGFIRDGHGDLYSANICFDNLKKVYIFDCIEFNERFRCGDVCSDIAFLAMDLDFHKERALSDYFITQYVSQSKDQGTKELLNFYKCYRAYVRGKVGCFTYASKEEGDPERNEVLEKARRYFDLAYHYAAGIPKLIIFMGLSGTGKSFLSQRLLSKLPAVYLSSDLIRKRLLSLNESQHYYAEFEKGIYAPEITEKIYQKMIEMAKEELSYGRDVILDATFRDIRYRSWLFDGLKGVKAEVFWIWCTAEDEVVKQRMLLRKEDTYSDALWDIYLAQKTKFEPPTECNPLLKLDTTQPVETLMFELTKFLKI